MLGNTVEITHANGTVSRYSNLASTNLPVIGTEVESGAKIGCVGDSAISELADEAHLHFEMLVNNTSVNPLDYISEEAKRVSLGITEEEAAREIEQEAFGDRAVRDALGNEAMLSEVLKKHKEFAAEYKASNEKDIVKFAEEFYHSDLEKFKKMVGGRYRCDAYFYNGALMECDCGFGNYRDIVDKFKLGRYDTDEDLLMKAKDFLSDDVRLLCEELNAGIIPMTTGEKH
jgi:hypothetical protein